MRRLKQIILNTSMVMMLVGAMMTASCCGINRVAGSKDVASVTVGKEYYVDAESHGGPADDANPGTREKPWKTFTRAFGGRKPAPGPGDTVNIRGGMYKETMVVSRGGAKGRPLVIRAYPEEQAVIDGDKTRSHGILFDPKGTADYVVIEGLSITNLESSLDPKDLSTWPGSGVWINLIGFREGIILRSLRIDGGSRGVFAAKVRGCKVINCDIQNTQEQGIEFAWKCEDIEIISNQVHHVGITPEGRKRGTEGDGIRLYSSQDGWFSRGKIEVIEKVKPGVASFCLKNPKTGEKVKLNAASAWTGGLIGQNETGAAALPALLVLFYSENPQFGDDAQIPGGTEVIPAGYRAFPLRSNPEWGGKPYSPDDTEGWFETGTASWEELGKAKYAFIYVRFPPTDSGGVDARIINNTVSDCGRQGILLTRWKNVLMEGNILHHNLATGIQVEGDCRNIRLRNNTAYANSRLASCETGFWIHGAHGVVAEDNKAYENVRGMWVCKSAQVLVRRNLIYDNQGQQALIESLKNSPPAWIKYWDHQTVGLIVSGNGFALRAECILPSHHITVVHNTLVENGHAKGQFGTGATLGSPGGFAPTRYTLFLNNIVTDNIGATDLNVLDETAILEGNLYWKTRSGFEILWNELPDRWQKWPHERYGVVYALTNAADFQKYRDEHKQDMHSILAPPLFAGLDKKDFRLEKNSPALDQAVPLARTLSDGTGTEMPVDRPGCFSDGMKNSKGEEWVAGDEIMVAGKKAKILAINNQVLKLDRALEWKKNDPVNYAYNGKGPDIGAIEK